VAILCRNHRWPIETTVACAKLGADVVYLDPTAPSESLARTIEQSKPRAIVYDDEFAEDLEAVPEREERFVAWCERDRRTDHPRLGDLQLWGGRERPQAVPGRKGRVWFASERPGDPVHELSNSLMIPGAVLSLIPLGARESTLIAAPLTSRWGFVHLILGLRLGSTVVLRRECTPARLLDTVAQHGVAAVALNPELLRGLVKLPANTFARHDLSSLRILAVPGVGLPSELAIPAIARFGNILFNLNGTTVV
jgi:acyl-coenzyme A synthetase/AMP-(fatty) acid ligase